MERTVCEYEEQISHLSLEIIDKAIKIIPHGDISASNIVNKSTRKRYIGINKAIFLLLRVNKDGYKEKY